MKLCQEDLYYRYTNPMPTWVPKNRKWDIRCSGVHDKVDKFLSLSPKKNSHKQVVCIESENVFVFNDQHEDNL